MLQTSPAFACESRGIDDGSGSTSVGGAGMRREDLHSTQVYVTVFPCDEDARQLSEACNRLDNNTGTFGSNNCRRPRDKNDVATSTDCPFHSWISIMHNLSNQMISTGMGQRTFLQRFSSPLLSLT
jgi:hypothetical protein